MYNAIETLGIPKVKEIVNRYARELKIPPELHIEYVCNACCDNRDLAPDMNENRPSPLSPEESVEKWVERFMNGYKNRISKRESKISGTVPDKAVGIILSTCLRCEKQVIIDSLVYAHRLAMSAENILGLLLEEFLFSKLSPLGWAMAWGSTIKSVDFCNAAGVLLQVKNRSNSENSSSIKVREGTEIQLWFRVKANNGHYNWDTLPQRIGAPPEFVVCERAFQDFIKKTLDENPLAIAIEGENPWGLILGNLEDFLDALKS